jgi:hypothetical protein
VAAILVFTVYANRAMCARLGYGVRVALIASLDGSELVTLYSQEWSFVSITNR